LYRKALPDSPVMENVVHHDELAALNDAGYNEFVRWLNEVQHLATS
jgi:hypothetical protein